MPEDRAVVVQTAAGEKLTFTHLVGFDELSRGFAFTVGLAGPDLEIKAASLLGKPMAIEAESGDPKRWFHGLVTEVRLVKVDSDAAPLLSARFAVRTIPTLLLIRRDRELARTSGAMPLGQLVAWTRDHLAEARV